jgi:hypothetical protein
MDELIKDPIRVSWVELGEGLCEDYNPDDPNDVELLRFDVDWLESSSEPLVMGGEKNWVAIDDASYCTQVPVLATPEERGKLLEIIMDWVYEPASQGYSIKKICERLSWISLDWLKPPEEGNLSSGSSKGYSEACGYWD